MADGDVKDYAGEKKKPSLALVISVGPKMPKKPEDTSKPDEPMKKAWHTLVEHVGTYELSKEQYYTGFNEAGDRVDPSGAFIPDADMTDEEHMQMVRDHMAKPMNERRIMEMLPPIPPREERRNMMRDGTQHSPGQQSMIDRATEMLRQQKIAEAQERMKRMEE